MYAGVGAWPPVWPVWANLFSVKSCVMVDKTVLRAAKLRVQNYFARIMQSLGIGWEGMGGGLVDWEMKKDKAAENAWAHFLCWRANSMVRRIQINSSMVLGPQLNLSMVRGTQLNLSMVRRTQLNLSMVRGTQLNLSVVRGTQLNFSIAVGPN